MTRRKTRRHNVTDAPATRKTLCETCLIVGFYTERRSLCLPSAFMNLDRSPRDAQGRQNDRVGRSMNAQNTLRHRHGPPWSPRTPSSFGHAQNKRRGNAELAERPGVVERRQKEGTGIVLKVEGRQNDRPMIAIVYDGGATASLLRSFCVH